MKNKNLLVLIIFFVVLFNSIVYSALNSEMFINGDAHIRVDKDIRITDVKVLEQTNGSYETYSSDYSKNTTSIQVTLPSSASVMIYEVTITNKGDIDYEVTNIIEESYSNSSVKYELIDIEKGEVIDGGTTHKFKIKFTTTENNPDNKTTLVLKYTFKEWIPTLYNMVAHKSRGLDTDIDFGVVPTNETSGVYEVDSTKEDEFPVYYYRGIIDNNNVNFAGFCWKIVRTTSTGGVKLIYNGIVSDNGGCDNTGVASQIGTSQFNSNSTSMEDVSYVYDNGNDSAIKKVIDKWYSDNMLGYTNMLEDTIWCNNRDVSRYSSPYTFFESRVRLIESPFEPVITCSNKNDEFTVNLDDGNGKLKYPVALLTGDEVTLAGSGYGGYNISSYLNTSQTWWTMSPHFFHSNSTLSVSDVLVMKNDRNSLTGMYVNLNGGVRPSISLVSGTMIKEGNGSVTNPYKLVEDKITKEWSFDYTGEEQEFIVPYDGEYKIELWGAQGGDASSVYVGGFGAYAAGNIQLDENDILYINIGSKGDKITGIGSNIMAKGGYNGGGYGYSQTVNNAIVCGGGGGTHISTKSGLLSSLSDSLIDVIIVSGAGGGGSLFGNNNNVGRGGNAGGIVGSNSTLPGPHTIQYNRYGIGGTQNKRDCLYINNGTLEACNYFGTGQNADDGGSGGGGGYYGGTFGHGTGGGGGSSYIGNSLLKNKVMYCYECEESNEESTKTISTTNVSEEPVSNYAKSGNGYAKITLISKK